MELRKRALAGGDQGEELVILDDEVIAEGAFVLQGSTGFATEADAVANPILGLATGFRNSENIPLGSGYDSTADYAAFTQSRLGNTVTATATNEATEETKVQYYPVHAGDVFVGELDAAVNTTTGSGIPGYFISVLTTDATKLDENTASTSQQHFKLVDNGEGTTSAVDPQRGGNFVLFKVTEIQDLQSQI